MRIILYGLAWGSIVGGLVHEAFALPGSRRETEAAILLLCGLLLGAIAFLMTRLQTSKCSGCGARVGLDAAHCNDCGTPSAHPHGRCES